jgi:hypothetical protein
MVYKYCIRKLIFYLNISDSEKIIIGKSKYHFGQVIIRKKKLIQSDAEQTQTCLPAGREAQRK